MTLQHSTLNRSTLVWVLVAWAWSTQWCAAQAPAVGTPPAAVGTAPAGAKPLAAAASVFDLVAILQSVDPYRTDKELKGTVRVFGSTSMDSMAHVWVTGFNQFHKNAKVEISAFGSIEAFDKLLAQPNSVAMLSHPVRNEDLTALKAKGLKEPVAFVVAREALGVFVHKSNPVRAINGEQLRMVFTAGGDGKLTWGALGATGEWADKPIDIIARTEASGTQVYLRDFVFGGSTIREPKSAHVSNAEVLTTVGTNPNAIAICGLKTPGSNARSLSLMAGGMAIPSDDQGVLSGQYPLTRPLTLVVDLGQTDADAKVAQEFVHFALCQAGQAAAIGATFYPADLPLLRASLHRLQGTQIR